MLRPGFASDVDREPDVADVRVDSAAKYFGDFAAVENVSTTFREGTVTVLLGPSGCGKTTLMRMIVGLETPTTGKIFIGDREVTKMPTSERKIGMVFQYPVIYRGTTVERNIELPLIAAKINAAERKRRVDSVAEVVGIADLLKMNVDRLDNAGRQRVAVAREVARQPEVLLFDEPITNVDLTSKLELKRSLKNLFMSLKQTIIYVTHDQTEAMSLADNIALMNNGRIVQMGKPRDIYAQPNDVFAGWFLGSPGMNFLTNCFVVEHGQLRSPLLASPLPVNENATHAKVLGIRPERVRMSLRPTDSGVPAEVLTRAITIGGRILLDLKVQDVILKAVVDDNLAGAVGDQMWMTLPPSEMRLFGADDRVIEAGLGGQ
jgi:ABC-type sugar transport system ATPase subunit